MGRGRITPSEFQMGGRLLRRAGAAPSRTRYQRVWERGWSGTASPRHASEEPASEGPDLRVRMPKSSNPQRPTFGWVAWYPPRLEIPWLVNHSSCI